jgi:hypothetical protein
MYSAEQINKMELEILQALEWRVNGPTPHDFIDSFLEIVPSIKAPHRDFLASVSKVLAELAVARYSVALHQPSAIAFASVCCALQTMEAVTFTSSDCVSVLRYLQMVSGFSFNDPSLSSLFNTMVCLNQELSSESPDVHVAVSVETNDAYSVSSEVSPNCIVRY